MVGVDMVGQQNCVSVLCNAKNLINNGNGTVSPGLGQFFSVSKKTDKPNTGLILKFLQEENGV